MVNVPGRRPQNVATRSAKRSGFVYVPRTAESVKERAERKGGRFDSPFKSGFDTWRPKEGDNLIRILPPTWEERDHFGYRVWMHRFVGADNSTYLCPLKMQNKRCPICAAAKAAKDAGEEDDAKQLQASEQIITWILDRDADDDIPKLFAMSWTMDRDICSLIYSKRSGEVLLIDHPDEGFDLTIKRYGTGMRTKYSGMQFDRQPTPIAQDQKTMDEIIGFIEENPIPSVLQYYPYDYLEKVITGATEAPDPDLDEQADTSQDYDHEEEEAAAEVAASKPRTARVAATPGRKAKAPPPEDEEEEDEFIPDDEEEEEEPRVAAKKAKVAAPPEEEEEEIEPEPRPRRREAPRAAPGNGGRDVPRSRGVRRGEDETPRSRPVRRGEEEDRRPVRRTYRD